MTNLPEQVELSSPADERAVWGYTSEQMLQFRRDVLDEAARVCDNAAKPEPLCGQTDEEFACSWCADAIRKMKEET